MEDCRKLAADLGWQVGEEYVDIDFSAYSGIRARTTCGCLRTWRPGPATACWSMT